MASFKLMLLLLFAMIRSVVKSVKVPVYEVAELTNLSHQISATAAHVTSPSGVRCKRTSVSCPVVKLHSQYRCRLDH